MKPSKIILGTVQMGMKYGINNHLDKISTEEAHYIFEKAYHAGIRMLDTAEAYGNAHEVIGSYNRSAPDKRFRVITKVRGNTTDDKIGEKVKCFCKELAVDSLEALMFHSFSSYERSRNQSGVLRSLKEDKLIGRLGVSVYTNDEFSSVLEDPDMDVIQIPFNLLDNYSKRGVLLKEARKKGKIIHSRSVFLQGLFFKNPADTNPVVHALKDELSAIQQIAVDNRVSMTQLALSYCLNQQEIDQVLIGVDSIAHVEENIRAAQYDINEDTVRKINRVNTRNARLLNPTVWNQ